MRILIWTDAYWPEIGGLEVFCMRLATALQNRGHDCLVIANRNYPGNGGLKWHGEIAVHGFHFIRNRQNGDLAALRRDHLACVQIISEFKPEIIHLNAISRSLLNFILLQRGQRYPAVLTLHDPHVFAIKSILAPLMENVDRLVAISEYVRKETASAFPSAEAKLGKIVNALPDTSLPPSPVPDHQKILGFGRLVGDKGFDVLIKAFARIAPEFPGVTLTLAGDGVERPALEKLAGNSGCGERIYFMGWVLPDKMPEVILAHQMVVVPSRWQEPFGLVALQALQEGRPVIASTAGGLPEIVSDGETGRLFENENDLELAACLRQLLSDPALAARMGEKGRERAWKFFAFEDFVRAYENLFMKVVDESRNHDGSGSSLPVME